MAKKELFSLINADSEMAFTSILRLLKSGTGRMITKEILEKIVEKKEKVTVAFAKSYVGLGISDSRNEAIHNRLKAYIPKSERYPVVLEKVVDFIAKFNVRARRELLQDKH